MNNTLLEMQYFACTGVWGINGRNSYSNFEYLCNFAIVFCILGPSGGTKLIKMAAFPKSPIIQIRWLVLETEGHQRMYIGVILVDSK